METVWIRVFNDIGRFYFFCMLIRIILWLFSLKRTIQYIINFFRYRDIYFNFPKIHKLRWEFSIFLANFLFFLLAVWEWNLKSAAFLLFLPTAFLYQIVCGFKFVYRIVCALRLRVWAARAGQVRGVRFPGIVINSIPFPSRRAQSNC